MTTTTLGWQKLMVYLNDREYVRQRLAVFEHHIVCIACQIHLLEGVNYRCFTPDIDK